MNAPTAAPASLASSAFRPAARFLAAAREVAYIYARAAITCVKGPHRPREVLHYMYAIGVGSFPLIALCTAFAGTVVSEEMAYQMMQALKTVEMMPGFSAQFIFREIGVIIPSFLLVAKVGAATTAEVGTMKITEQIDALRLLQIDPIEYLVYPRFLASILMIACLTVLAIFITTGCALGVAVVKYNFNALQYLTALTHFIEMKDLVCAIVKGLSFGSVIPIIACYFGFNCTGGAEGVGLATTNSVVASTIVIIVLDFILTFGFSLIL